MNATPAPDTMFTDDRYRRAAAAGGVGVWEWTLATGDMYLDPVLKRQLGYQDHEICNHIDDWSRHLQPDDAVVVRQMAQAYIRGDLSSYEIEHRRLHRDGSVRWVLARGVVIRDAEGRAIAMAGTDTDITARKRGEEALRRAQELNRQIAESTGDCVKILALDGRLLYLNPEGLRMLELTDAGPMLNRTISTFFDRETAEMAEAACARARSGARGRFQYLMRTASGRATWWDAVITPITDGEGTVVQLLAISRDITDRRREEAFRAAETQVLEMIATSRPLAEVLDRIARLAENQADGMYCTVVLLDEDGTSVRHGAAPSLPAEYVRRLDGATIGPVAGSCGTAMYRGERVIVSDIVSDPLWAPYRDVAHQFGLRACWSTPIFSPQGRVLGSLAMYYGEPRSPSDAELRLIDTVAGLARVAIEQDRAYQALRHSEARNRAILRAIPDWMFLTTVDGVFLDYHARDTSRLHAAPEMFLGRRIQDVLPPPIAEALGAALKRASVSDEPEKVDYTLGSDGVECYYEACIVRCDGDKILSIVRDVTARRQAEFEADAHRRELAHLSRVSTIGELSGAVAHELSQPLATILINAQAARLLLDRQPLDASLFGAILDDIIRNDRRAGAVIDRLRALLRKGDTARQPVDVNHVVREVIELAYGELTSRRVTVQSSLPFGIPPVIGDRVQLEQVLLNLVLNACDAMGGIQAPHRQLSIATTAGDGFVNLIVSDRGTGIPEGQLERVFEPFVTFRERGLGLGLAISRSIVTAHGGSIRAENNGCGGATFRCRLPIAPAETSNTEPI